MSWRHTLWTVLSRLSTHHSLQRIALALAGAVADHVLFTRYATEAPGLYRVVARQLQRSTSDRHRTRVMRHTAKTAGVSPQEWSETDKVLLGKALLDLLIEATGLVQIDLVTKQAHRSELVVRPTEGARRNNGLCGRTPGYAFPEFTGGQET